MWHVSADSLLKLFFAPRGQPPRLSENTRKSRLVTWNLECPQLSVDLRLQTSSVLMSHMQHM
jgi:hypothetical protein